MLTVFVAPAMRALLIVVLVGAGLSVAAPKLLAQEAHFELSAPDAVKQALDQQAGKLVKVKLISGQDLEGMVTKVGTQAVHLAQLSGMDFYDAVVRLDQVAAVIVKMRTK